MATTVTEKHHLTTNARVAAAVAFWGTAFLVVLGVLWEIWLAPLRPGAWLLALKVAPLVPMLSGLRAGRLRSYQWMSMLVLLYLCEGTVRALSDPAPAARLALLEIAAAVIVYASVLTWISARRQAAARAR